LVATLALEITEGGAQQMHFCSLCETKLTTENDSREHIIPNSIGGRRKIKGFLCQTCNSTTGEDWDTELSKQLNPLCLIFFIKRERGNPPSQTFETTEGRSLTLHSEGGMSPAKVSFEEVTIDGKTSIKILARDIKEAKSILKGVKNKHPTINIDELVYDLKPTEEYLSGMLELDLAFGGPKSGKSLVKSALGLAHSAGIASNSCEQAIEYLRHDGSPCFGYYNEQDLVENRPLNTPLHCVAIQGDPESGLLLGYVEYFGIQRMVVCLSENYVGSKISTSYAIDPITGTELSLNIRIPLSLEDVYAIYNYEKYDYSKMKQCLDSVIPVALAMSESRERDRAVLEAVKFAFKNCGAMEGEVLTNDQYQKLCRLMAEKIAPYLLRHKPL
jgi:hypothetical protein